MLPLVQELGHVSVRNASTENVPVEILIRSALQNVTKEKCVQTKNNRALWFVALLVRLYYA